MLFIVMTTALGSRVVGAADPAQTVQTEYGTTDSITVQTFCGAPHVVLATVTAVPGARSSHGQPVTDITLGVELNLRGAAPPSITTSIEGGTIGTTTVSYGGGSMRQASLQAVVGSRYFLAVALPPPGWEAPGPNHVIALASIPVPAGTVLSGRGLVYAAERLLDEHCQSTPIE